MCVVGGACSGRSYIPLLADSMRLGSCGCVFSSLTALP